MSTIDISFGQSDVGSMTAAKAAAHPVGGVTTAVDPDLVQQNRIEIRRLVREITELCRSDSTCDEFFEAFLSRVVTALAAVGGAIWTRDAQGQLRLRYHVNLPQEEIAGSESSATQHARLLQHVGIVGRPLLLSPQSSGTDDATLRNPTDWLLLLGTMDVDDDVCAILEVFQRPGGGPVTQRGYLRFLTQMCELADGFLKDRRLRELKRQQATWKETEHYIQTIHEQRRVLDTASAIANEGRRYLGVDRVSVVARRGTRFEVLAVSGADTIDRRADQIADLARLSQLATATRETVWYPNLSMEHPPQIEAAFQAALDHSHARLIGVLPLQTRGEEDDGQPPEDEPAFGAMIVEQFRDAGIADELLRRSDVAGRHASSALGNALRSRPGVLLSIGTASPNARTTIARLALSKTAAALAVAVLVAIALVFVPTQLTIPARGRLLPSSRRNVYAPQDGSVQQVLVRHGQFVRTGEVLLRLHNAECDIEIESLRGQRETLAEQALAIQRTLLKQATLAATERDRLTGELEQIQRRQAGIGRQLEVWQRRRDKLVVRSPMSGRIVTWAVDDALAGRPLHEGQLLMTVVDPDGDWELELTVQQRDAGWLAPAAWQTTGVQCENRTDVKPNGPTTSFSLRTHPGQEFEGRIVDVGRSSHRDESGRHVVLLRARVDRRQLPEPRYGTTVRARIDCGSHSIGYVWFRDLIEAVHSEVLFWL